MKKSARDTPMMRHFMAVKADHPDAIVFYRMGDFYEMFLHDAEVAAPLLDIALTTRDKNAEDPIPMCGVPVHAADAHIKRLAELGHRVAICEQVEDPRHAGRRLVRREVVEVVTPGLVGDPDGIEASRELCLAALDAGPRQAGLAILDASTGELRATQVSRDGDGLPPAILEELQRVEPREILLASDAFDAVFDALLPHAARTRLDPAAFDPHGCPRPPRGFDADSSDASMRAAAALVGYVAEHQPFALAHTSRLRAYELTDAMVLDAATRAHLELFRNSEDGSRARTLIEQLDATATALGARRLARWLAYPLVDVDAIRARHDAVASLAGRDRLRARLRAALKPVRDLERLLAKAGRPSSTPRDLAALRASLEALPGVGEALASGEGELPLVDADAGSASGLLRAPAPLPDVARVLREALVDDPPAVLKGSRGANETGYIRDGFRSELDGLRNGVDKGRDWIAGFEARERDRTGIDKLKIRHHPVHGYGIEISKAQLGRVPDDYERKQTLANAERFTTAELRAVEQNVRGGTEQAAALEREIFEELRAGVMEHAAGIREAAEAVAELDAFASLAEVARRDDWVRPEVDTELRLEIRAGRHPVVEPLLAARGGDAFVPNDAQLDSNGDQILVLTGPNMSGKSTYLRQVALTVLLAQMGSFVPAHSARIGVVDRVFTRVGASDRLARGESTFMVEMRETAEILAAASPRSLIILDEIGRGTSTFDGLSIAWAVAEHLHDGAGLGARTLFATHYHELADLARTKPRVANAHFGAKEWGDEVVFLRRLEPGAANRSYGIQVARLAGLPASVIDRARAILGNLESGEFDAFGRPRIAGASPDAGPAGDQLGLFAPAGGAPARDPAEQDVLDRLRETDPEHTTPLQALELLAQIRERLKRAGDA